MKKLNENSIMVTYRNMKNFNLKDDAFTIPIYSSALGVIMDWSCNDNVEFEVRTFIKIILLFLLFKI